MTLNVRYRHAFAIIRIDDDFDQSTPIEHRVTVTKVVPTIEEAEREGERLNKLREGKGGRHFWKLTLIKPMHS